MPSRLYAWLDSRLRLTPLKQTLLDEPIPGGASWIYVFGSVTLFLFGVQVMTGMFLAVYYVPSPDAAYDTVQFIQHEVDFGWFVRGLHHWGASAVMVAIGLHLLQVYLYGAYKPPRELMWMVGVVLLILTLAFGFTGYLLPWDQNAYWATQVGTNMVASIPLIGDFLVRLLRGGDTLGVLTLSRFFALHVLFLPALIVCGILLHLFILRRVGPAGPWSEEQARRRSEAFYPRQIYMDAVAMLGAFFMVVLLAATIEFPLADRADPSDHTFTPVPEWYFLFLYELLKHVPGRLEALATWVLPALFLLVLLAWPFLDRNPERRPTGRPLALAAGSVVVLAILTLMGISLRNLYAVPRTDPSVARGKVLFAKHHCLACHRLHGEGGTLGPDLSYVGDTRSDRQWLIRHFLDPKSVSPGSVMPKFALPEKELSDLASFMISLRSGVGGRSVGSNVTGEPPSATGEAPTPSTIPTAAATPAESPHETTAGSTVPAISRDPADLPGPVTRPAGHTRVNLEAVEVEGQLAEGASYRYMTFNGRVPGPLIRVRMGDTVELHLKNHAGSQLAHSIDLHAVTGPGGGSSLTQSSPGQEKVLTFQALKPGLFVYHCATAMVAEHITSGMYGLILVEPSKGLPAVDHEFYVMQGEIYTRQPFGEYGLQEFDRRKLLDERPEYLVFNGAVNALTKDHPLHAKVGETVRIFFGVGGPNRIASFHLIGEHWDRVYDQASLTSAPLTNVQTTVVPPGGATVVEFTLEMPGRFLLVDHALSRLEHGLLGFLQVEGPANPRIFREGGS
jgi:copper-containing nitrite reductase